MPPRQRYKLRLIPGPDEHKDQLLRAPVRPRKGLHIHHPNSLVWSTEAVALVVSQSEVIAESGSILSWLIDKKKVQVGGRVYWVEKHDTRKVKGQVSDNPYHGIKCDCCQILYTISAFDVHAGGNGDNPYAKIFLEAPQGTKSLIDCQRELICESHQGLFKGESDYVCSICHSRGFPDEMKEMCSGCASSFHKNCVGMQIYPAGDHSYCLFCCCSFCLMSPEGVDDSMTFCHQCEHNYHVGCRREGKTILCGTDPKPKRRWFCGAPCATIYHGLQNHLGKRHDTSKDGFTWTLIKPIEYDDGNEIKVSHIDSWAVTHSKLLVALELLKSCFQPFKEPWTGRDLLTDVVLSRRSELKRLNFSGTYTVLLEKEEELIAVAVIRVFGEEVAEILPFVALQLFGHKKNYVTLLKALEEVVPLLSPFRPSSLENDKQKKQRAFPWPISLKIVDAEKSTNLVLKTNFNSMKL